MLIAAFQIENSASPSFFWKAVYAGFNSGSDSQTANQLVPESNHTSRMSVSLRNSVPPQCAQLRACGQQRIDGVVCQASMPSRSISPTISRFSAASMIGWLHCFAQKDGDGHAPDASGG